MMKRVMPSYSLIFPSQVITTKRMTERMYMMTSLVTGYQSNFIGVEAKRPPKEATPRVLNMEEPTTVPIPISDSVRNVPIRFMNNSGVEVAMDIKVAAATFWDKLKTSQILSTQGMK